MEHKLAPFAVVKDRNNPKQIYSPLTCILFLLFIICSGNIQSQVAAQVTKTDSLILGNCQKKIVALENIYSDNKTGGSALYYPESTMQLFKECEITDIYLGIDNFTNTESLELFISHALEEPYDYIQSVTPTQNKWNKVALDTPFKLDGSALYIGYTIKGTLLSYTEMKEVNEEWINQRGNKWGKYTGKYSAALYAVVKGGEKLPSSNARIKKVKMPYYTLMDTPVPFSGTISNLGTESIQEFEITYQVGEQQYKETVRGVDIPSQSEIQFHTNGLKISQEGEYDLTLSVTSLNGKPDQDRSDNSSRTVSLLSRKHFTDRKVLLELFSTEVCPNCPDAHKLIARELEGNDRILELNHHSGYYEDSFTIDASSQYIWFYKPQFLYAPAQMLDRNNLYDNYPEFYIPETPVIAVNDQSFITTCNEAMKVPAFATVNLSAKRVGESGRNISIRVDGKGILPIPDNGNDRLYIFLTEDSIYSTTQSGASRGFYHNHTARLCVTDRWGDSIQIAKGYEADYTVEIPEEWNAAQMHAIAFVGNYDVNDRNNCRIYNAEIISLKSLLPASIEQTPGQMSPVVQEGNHLYIPGGYASVKIYAPDGKCLLNDSESKERLALEQLPKGIYILRVNTGKRQEVFKINL